MLGRREFGQEVILKISDDPSLDLRIQGQQNGTKPNQSIVKLRNFFGGETKFAKKSWDFDYALFPNFKES